MVLPVHAPPVLNFKARIRVRVKIRFRVSIRDMDSVRVGMIFRVRVRFSIDAVEGNKQNSFPVLAY